MNSTQLQCGHYFMWSLDAPDDLVFCFRCDGYVYPNGWEPAPPRKKRINAAPVVAKSTKPRLRKADVPLAKKKCAAMLAEGVHPILVAAEIGVSVSTVRKWRDHA